MQSKNTPRGIRALDLSTLLFIGMHASLLATLFVPFSWQLAALALGGYLLRMFGITAGYHRYFSHRSFKTSRAFQFILGVLGVIAMQNGPIWWASWHRRHHKDADTASDPHSPIIHGFWQSHAGWIFEPESAAPDLSKVKDLTRFPELVFLDRHKWFPLVAYGVGCFAIAGAAGLVWGFIVPTMLALHATMLINSVAHVWGSRRYATRDGSRNNGLLALLTLGEGWHNNHHHCKHVARQGFFWWEIDMTYYALKVLAFLGIIWDVREPSATVLAAGRVVPTVLPIVPAPRIA